VAATRGWSEQRQLQHRRISPWWRRRVTAASMEHCHRHHLRGSDRDPSTAANPAVQRGIRRHFYRVRAMSSSWRVGGRATDELNNNCYYYFFPSCGSVGGLGTPASRRTSR
jgi:hypothetical protein